MDGQTTTEKTPACNSTYPKGGGSCSKDSFVGNQKLVFQIKFYGKIPALRVAEKPLWVSLCTVKKQIFFISH